MRRSQPVTRNYSRPMQLSLIVGVVAAVVAVIGYFVSGGPLFFQAYLFGYVFWLGISLGSLAFLLLHLLSGSRWGLTVRRVVEAASSSTWIMAVLFIPILLGLGVLYPWANPQVVEGNHLLEAKVFYLNVPFFIVRAVIYFAVWIAVAYFVNRSIARLATTTTDAPALKSRLQSMGAFGLIVYVLSMTFAAVDWLMSLQPEYNSTAFGLIMIVGQVLTALSFAILMLNLFPELTRGRTWTVDRTPIPFKDLGALMLTFVMGWAYLAYFQLLIQWAGNIPREVVWYIARNEGGWSLVSIFIAVFQFVLPFLILLTARVRHNLRALAALGGLLLFVYLVNMFWHVKPAFSPGVFSVSWLDIVLPVAVGGIWLAGFFYYLARRPALSTVDEAEISITTERERAIP